MYRRYATPWEVLRELSPASQEQPNYLKPPLSIPVLDQMAQMHSDTESAKRMQEAKRKLFLGFRQGRKSA